MKRFLDIVLILLSLPVSLPLFLITFAAVRIRLGKPVFFCQERAGLDGHPFIMIKFRSMLDERNDEGELLPDEQRLTGFGRILRKYSLDELPELLNVLRGDMSLVGPRPLPLTYVARYTPFQSRRLKCIPGITGWAQVNGRNLLDWEQRFQHDVWYVDNRNLLLDFKILLLTIIAVIRSEGISSPGEATMSEFMGTDEHQS